MKFQFLACVMNGMLFAQEFLQATELASKLGIYERSPAPQKESVKLQSFLSTACSNVTMQAQQATFAILFSNHKMSQIFTESSDQQLLNCDTMQLLLSVLHVLYPVDDFEQFVLPSKNCNKKMPAETRKESSERGSYRSREISGTASSCSTLSEHQSCRRSSSIITTSSFVRDFPNVDFSTENLSRKHRGLSMLREADEQLQNEKEEDKDVDDDYDDDDDDDNDEETKASRSSQLGFNNRTLAKLLRKNSASQNHIIRVCLRRTPKNEKTKPTSVPVEHYYVIFTKPFKNKDLILTFGCPVHDPDHKLCAQVSQKMILQLQTFIEFLQTENQEQSKQTNYVKDLNSTFEELLDLQDCESTISFLSSVLNEFNRTAGNRHMPRGSTIVKCSDILNAMKYSYEQMFMNQEFYVASDEKLASCFDVIKEQTVKFRVAARGTLSSLGVLDPMLHLGWESENLLKCGAIIAQFPPLVYFVHTNVQSKFGIAPKFKLSSQNRDLIKIITHAYHVNEVLTAKNRTVEFAWRGDQFLFTRTIFIGSAGDVLETIDRNIYKLFCVFLPFCKASAALSWTKSLHRLLYDEFIQNDKRFL
ncbi:uncharacterized protein LOC134845666 isoform X2 [Symsagittifera roscoffensis]|uniref:uncharacterized protein LOC134845666 isoform X2 n=1 Tax=Symsagittifera roscoffensis TaxID=84072 RepID=UPI00307C5B79